jgi:hypothetical protein
LWRETAITRYGTAGGRDVLILAPDLSLPHPEAVARRPGQLTEEDKLKLLRQGVFPESDNELDTIRAIDTDLPKAIQLLKSSQGSQYHIKKSWEA